MRLVDVTEPPEGFAEPCLIWRGKQDDDAYAIFKVDGRTWRAHRWSYQQWIGPLIPGMHVDHLCNRTMCVQPVHLEQVTHAENQRRKTDRATTCGKGLHPYPGPGKECSTCVAERARQYRIRKKQRKEGN